MGVGIVWCFLDMLEENIDKRVVLVEVKKFELKGIFERNRFIVLDDIVRVFE